MNISVVPLSVKLSSKSTFNLQTASLLLGNLQLALGVLDCNGLMLIIFSLHIQSNLKIMFSNNGEAKHVIRDWFKVSRYLTLALYIPAYCSTAASKQFSADTLNKLEKSMTHQ